MKKQNGFTLIELVIVIIVLGILAATAVPKFINLQDDAKISAMNGVEAAVRSAANIVYSKSAIDGTEASTSASSAAGVTTIFGYPTADANGIAKAVELSGFEVITTAQTADTATFVAEKEKASSDLCLSYSKPTANGYVLAKGKMNSTLCVTTGINGNW